MPTLVLNAHGVPPALQDFLLDRAPVATCFLPDPDVTDIAASESVLALVLHLAANQPGDYLWVGPRASIECHRAREMLSDLSRRAWRGGTSSIEINRGRVWFRTPDLSRAVRAADCRLLVIADADAVPERPTMPAERTIAFGAVPARGDHWLVQLSRDPGTSHHAVTAADVARHLRDADLRGAVERARADLPPDEFARRYEARWEEDTSGAAAAEERRSLHLLDWAKRYLPEFFPLPDSQMHRWIAGRLASMHRQRGQHLDIIGTRLSAKSTWLSLVYPLYAIVNGLEPYIWFISDTGDQADLNLMTLRGQLEGNPLLAEDYPGACGQGRVWRERRIITRNGIMVEAMGAGKSLRGRRKDQHRPSLIIVDDPEGEDAITSARVRERRRIWFDRALMKAGTRDTNVIVAGNVLHRECLVLTLEARPGWEAHKFPSILKWPTRMDLWARWEEILFDPSHPSKEAGTAAALAFYEGQRAEMERGAEVLWPERESLYDLMLMRASEGHRSFEAEKQCRAVSPEEVEWPDEYFGEHIWFTDWPKDLLVKVVSLDPSKGKDARRGDFSAIVKFGRDARGTCYVEADLKRRDTSRMVTDTVETCFAFKPDALALETNQFQSLLAEDIAQEGRRLGYIVPVWEVENTVPKPVRIRRNGPYLAQRQMRFKAGSPGTALLVDQLREFPMGEHDDGPDALEMAIRVAISVWNGAAQGTRLSQVV